MAHAEFSTGLGIFANNINETTSSNDAKKALLGPIFYPILLRYKTEPMIFGGSLAPFFEFTHLTTLLIKNETPDGSAKRNFMILGSPLEYKIMPSTQVKFGPALMYYEIKGKGGTKQIANGTGTSTFAVPSQTRSSKILMLQLGFGWDFDQWRFDGDLFLSGLAGKRYANSFQLSVARSFGGSTW